MAGFDTFCARVGLAPDATGAVSSPIYQTSTFVHPGLGESTGYDYTRTINPTRRLLEGALAELEGGVRGFAFASGMAAISTVFCLLGAGKRVIVSEDLYGGTYRVLDQVFSGFGLSADYVDTTDVEAVTARIGPQTAALFVESPTNPTMRVSDLAALARVAKEHDLLFIVDNTFLTPVLQSPLALGADIVVHSATKFLAGHNDVLAGAAVVADAAVGDRLFTLQNSIGAVLAPFDCWLTMRGLKTLPLRLARQVESAGRVALWLEAHPAVQRVYYAGLESHASYELNRRQARGAGAVVSFELGGREAVAKVLRKLKLVSYAESLGGVESLITFPFTQTHRDIPEDQRRRLGVTDGLLRLSVGIENVADIVDDLSQALT